VVLNNTICFAAFFPLLLSLAASTAAAAAFVSAAASWLARVLPLPAKWGSPQQQHKQKRICLLTSS